MEDEKTLCKNKLKEKKCCVIIPTYNNDKTIKAVIDDVLEYCDNIYVVNDGSTDKTPILLNEYKTQVKLCGYEKNQGKGYAIVRGFRNAIKDGFHYAITIDSDGQHFAHDLPHFANIIEQEPQSVIIGARPQVQDNKSAGSSFANKFSNFWFKIETGISIDDTQSGYRLYPLIPISKMRFYTNKYEFEIEVIVRLSWRNCNVITIPIDVHYPEKEERVTHFRPFKDFFRISILNTIFVFLAFIFFLPRNIIRKNRNKN